MADKLPSKTKPLSDERGRRNGYGENSKSSRKNIHRRQQAVNQTNRHAHKQLRGAIDPETCEAIPGSEACRLLRTVASLSHGPQPRGAFMRWFTAVTTWLTLLVLLVSSDLRMAGAEEFHLVEVDPTPLGMSARRLAVIDDIVAEGLRDKKMPGAVVLIGFKGQIVYRKAFGQRQLEPTPEPMTVDTVFDLASLTKPIATATSIMQLVEAGKIGLDDPVAKSLPAFAKQGKESITIRHLLTHQGGLIADNSMKDFADGRVRSVENLMALAPLAAPTEKFIYSDVGFMVLGELVAAVSGQSQEEYTRTHLFEPLGMLETMYRPTSIAVERFAPTEKRDGHWMRGEVHDPRAFALGGVAGHAGLFSTADDLARYAQAMLNGGQLGETRILLAETVQLMTSAHSIPGCGIRGLGWDQKSGYSSNRGDLLSPSACGHGGFTGTALWFDSEQQLFVIFLSSRLHPKGEGHVNPLIGRIGTIAAAAIREFE